MYFSFISCRRLKDQLEQKNDIYLHSSLTVAWPAHPWFALQRVPHWKILTIYHPRPKWGPHLENRWFSVQIRQENGNIDAGDASRFSAGIVDSMLRRSLRFSGNVERSYGQRQHDRRIDIKFFKLQERVTSPIYRTRSFMERAPPVNAPANAEFSSQPFT